MFNIFSAISTITFVYTVFFLQSGYTPLHVASESGQTDVVSLLLDHGSNIHAESVVGCFMYTCISRGVYMKEVICKEENNCRVQQIIWIHSFNLPLILYIT